MCGPHEKTQLAVLWTRGDREVADTMVYMYVRNAKQHGWWRHISLIVWGPSIKLLAEDVDLQEKTKELIQLGVDVSACAAAANMYNATEKLQELGVDVRGMGPGLTEVLHDEDEDWAFLSV
jgi:hypothetical protein